MLKKMTQQYIDFFSKKDLDGIASLLDDNFILEDPVVKKLEGKNLALDAIKNIFESCSSLSFSAKNIFQENTTTIIEFVLQLDDSKLEGVDIIEWKGKKMKQLRAYLDIPK